MTEIDYGWLIRSIHSWSANLLVGVLLLHLLTTFIMRAYRRPREATWVTGLLLLGVFFAFGFSGYLLPWNQLAFFATRVGTQIMGAVPVIGKPMLLVAQRRGGHRRYAGSILLAARGHPAPRNAGYLGHASLSGSEARNECSGRRCEELGWRQKGPLDAVRASFSSARHGRLVYRVGLVGGPGGDVSLGTWPEGQSVRLSAGRDQAGVVFPLHVRDAQATTGSRARSRGRNRGSALFRPRGIDRAGGPAPGLACGTRATPPSPEFPRELGRRWLHLADRRGL